MYGWLTVRQINIGKKEKDKKNLLIILKWLKCIAIFFMLILYGIVLNMLLNFEQNWVSCSYKFFLSVFWSLLDTKSYLTREILTVDGDNQQPGTFEQNNVWFQLR